MGLVALMANLPGLGNWWYSSAAWCSRARLSIKAGGTEVGFWGWCWDMDISQTVQGACCTIKATRADNGQLGCAVSRAKNGQNFRAAIVEGRSMNALPLRCFGAHAPTGACST